MRVGQLAELAIAHFLRGEHEEAVKIASVGLSKATRAQQRAGFYALIAQNQGALGRNEEAGQTALAGQRLSPDNKLLAFYRIANFERSGNRTQADIARNHLMRLDPDFALNPKCEPLTLATIVIVTAIIAATTVTVVVAKEINKADSGEKVVALMEVGKTALHVFGEALEVSANFAEIGGRVAKTTIR